MAKEKADSKFKGDALSAEADGQSLYEQNLQIIRNLKEAVPDATSGKVKTVKAPKPQ